MRWLSSVCALLQCAGACADGYVIEPADAVDVQAVTRALQKPPEDPAEPRTRSIIKRPATAPPGIELRIQFEFDSAILPPLPQKQLDAVAAGIRALDGAPRIVVEGHTDAVGTESHNDDLSMQRARSVCNYLIERGVPRSWLEVSGVGSRRLLVPEEPDSARNRRVELRRID